MNTSRLTTMPTTPRIYVACLAAYNNGKLHGEWINANQDEEDIMDEIKAMLAESPEPDAEEWAIHDYEYFHGVSIHEYESISKVAALAEFLDDYGEAFALWLDYHGSTHDINDETEEEFTDAYMGEYEDAADFAQQMNSDIECAEHAQRYIDWERWGNDLLIDGYHAAENSERNIYVYSLA